MKGINQNLLIYILYKEQRNPILFSINICLCIKTKELGIKDLG